MNSSYSQTMATQIKPPCLLQPLQPCSSRPHLWRWHFLHFINSITLHTIHNGQRYHVHTRFWTTTRWKWRHIRMLIQLTQDHLSTTSTSVNTTCNRVLGRRKQPYTMEQLWQRGPTYQKHKLTQKQISRRHTTTEVQKQRQHAFNTTQTLKCCTLFDFYMNFFVLIYVVYLTY
jgi:hypothetical protein